MQTPTCPQCQQTIAPADVHVGNDRAYCQACDASFSLAELTHGLAADPNVDLHHPPEGAWYRDDGVQKVIGATGRSIPAALGMAAVALIWNGVVSIFASIAVVSAMRHAGLAVPAFAPEALIQATRSMPLSATILLCLFITPFVLIGVLFIAVIPTYLIGRIEVTLTDVHGTVFHGYGPFGARKHFDPASVQAVRILVVRHQNMSHRHRPHTTQSRHLLIEARNAKPIKFGSFLTDARRNFLLSALIAALKDKMESASPRRGKASR